MSKFLSNTLVILALSVLSSGQVFSQTIATGRATAEVIDGINVSQASVVSKSLNSFIESVNLKEAILSTPFENLLTVKDDPFSHNLGLYSSSRSQNKARFGLNNDHYSHLGNIQLNLQEELLCNVFFKRKEMVIAFN